MRASGCSSDIIHPMNTRRAFVLGAASAPGILHAAKKSTTLNEVERKLTRKEDLPTPALIVDLDAFEANVKKMTTYVKEQGRAIRPHAKTHKCSEIAKYIIQQGAVGACAAKISEAEALAQNGVTGLLVTSAVIGKPKIEQAMRLAA